MLKMAFGLERKMKKTPCGGLEHDPHMTLNIESPSFFPDHGALGLSYVRWSCYCKVRIGSRACTKDGAARNDGGNGRKREVRRFPRRVKSSSPCDWRQACSGRRGEHSRRASGTTMGRRAYCASKASECLGWAGIICLPQNSFEDGSMGVETKGFSTDMCKG